MEVIKMKQGMAYSCKEKTIILNVFKYFKTENPEKSITEIVRCTAKATGCSEKSIFQFRKEEKSENGVREPSRKKIRKNININSRFIKYDDSVREAIRLIIENLKHRNIIPSLNTILKNVNTDVSLPNFSLMTLRRLLFDMGFRYEKDKNFTKPVLVEGPKGKKEPSKSVKDQEIGNTDPKNEAVQFDFKPKSLTPSENTHLHQVYGESRFESQTASQSHGMHGLMMNQMGSHYGLHSNMHLKTEMTFVHLHPPPVNHHMVMQQ